jgi:hypothetical protein
MLYKRLGLYKLWITVNVSEYAVRRGGGGVAVRICWCYKSLPTYRGRCRRWQWPFWILRLPAESRGSTYAFMTSRKLCFQNLTWSCIRVVTSQDYFPRERERCNFCTVQRLAPLDKYVLALVQGWAVVLARGPLCGSRDWRRAAHFVEAEIGGGPHLLKWLHSLVNLAFQKRYKLYHKINKYKLNKIVAVLFNLFIVLKPDQREKHCACVLTWPS